MKIRLLISLASLATLTAILSPAPANAAGHGRFGTLDRSFGNGGKVFARAPKAAHSEFGAAELESDGDLVVELQREVVEREGGVREIERRLPDGSLDPSFGKDGRVRVGPGSGLAVRPTVRSSSAPIPAGRKRARSSF